MRWFWIDRFLEFQSGEHAKAVKNVSLAEDYLQQHFPGYPTMPSSLILEGMAQTGGLLICEHLQYARLVVLAKVPVVRFLFQALPGDTLTYTAKVCYVREEGSMVEVTSECRGRLQAEAELVYGHIDAKQRGGADVDASGLLTFMRTVGVFEVGRSADGQRLQFDSHHISAPPLPATPTGTLAPQ